MDDQFAVLINHIPNPELFGDIVELTIDSNVFMPTMCTITLQDSAEGVVGTLKYADSLTIQIGASVDVTAIHFEPDSEMPGLPEKVFSGEITSIEPVFSEKGNSILRIRAFDQSHRLTYGKKTRVFGSGMRGTTSEADIVNGIAAQNGLTPVVDPQLNGMRYSYVMQYNQTDWEFLWSRANLLGYQMYVDGKMLYFKPASAARSFSLIPKELTWKKDLARFEPRIVALGQVTGAAAHYYDSSAKKGFTGKAKMASNMPVKIPGAILPGNLAIKKAFSASGTDEISNPSIDDMSKATKAAQAILDQHASQFVRASGELAFYNPSIQAGVSVKVLGVGIRFSGEYYVTQAKHIWRAGAAKVTFEVTGRNPYTLRHILTGETPAAPKLDGVYIGLVTDTKDLQNQGRVRVKFPGLPMGGDFGEPASNWARVASVAAGNNRGILFLPEVDDEVLVMFEQGDINQPYIVGVLWNAKDKLPKGSKAAVGPSGSIDERIIRSRSGHVIVLDDSTGGEKITIIDKTGNNKIVLDSVKNSMEIAVQGDLTIDSKGKVKITGVGGVDVESKATLNIKAMTGTIEGTTNLTVKDGAGAQIALSGPSVNVNNGALEVM